MFYIGSTTNYEQRMKDHQAAVLNGKEGKLYDAMRKEGVENFQYKEWKNWDCFHDIRQLHWWEQKEIKLSNNIANGYNLVPVAMQPIHCALNKLTNLHQHSDLNIRLHNII